MPYDSLSHGKNEEGMCGETGRRLGDRQEGPGDTGLGPLEGRCSHGRVLRREGSGLFLLKKENSGSVEEQ